MNSSSIVVYDSGEIELKVSVENESVWLNRHQMAELFDRDIKTIGKHINNVFKEKELEQNSTVANFATVQNEGGREVTRDIEYYDLDVIISVGYRVKSQKGVRFRQWTTTVLKEYIYNGYAINSEKITQKRLLKIENDIENIKSHIINNSLELKQGIFYNGQIYDAYKFLDDILQTATKKITIIDNYIDNTLLTIISKYPKIEFVIITKTLSKQQKLDTVKYQQQHNNLTLKISNSFHDRFVIIDEDTAYHIGASLKDLGKKIFAFSKIDVDMVLETIKGANL